MCDKEPKDALKPPFQAGSGLNALAMQKDQLRTEILEGYDLKVIRLTNKQIDNQFGDVCQYIDTIVQNSLDKKPLT